MKARSDCNSGYILIQLVKLSGRRSETESKDTLNVRFQIVVEADSETGVFSHDILACRSK